MFLAGTINGVDVNTSVIRDDQFNIIVAKKIFSGLQVKGSVEPCQTCLIAGVHLSEWAATVVPRFGNVTVSEQVNVENAVFENSLSLQGTMNSVIVRRDNLMTLNDDQDVFAPISFSSKLPPELGDRHIVADDLNLAVQVDDLHIDGLYDGVNLTRFYDDSVINIHGPELTCIE